MALIKSKQIESLEAKKVTQTTDLQFVSQTEKDSFADKYTKSEVDSKLKDTNDSLQKQITENNTTVVTQITNVETELKNDVTVINTTTADLQVQIKTNADAASKQISDLDAKLEADVTAINKTTDNLQSQITTNNTNLSNQITAVNTSLQNQITSAIQGLSWKSPVDTFADIAKVYPKPEEGWVVTVDDTNKIYRYDAPTNTWVEFPIQLPTTYLNTINIIPSVNGQTSIDTGIRNDNTGVYKTGHNNIVLKVNGCAQVCGKDKDYTADFVNNSLVITWNNLNFILETSDELDVTYTHFEIV
ncbi:hypothetical protein [Clostridium felsineum]|uniref:hypothetical protein n=1 Tax=Clostridium felsineum TaxID=36839 RepID=UPI00098C020C|nr:hypothetical protein [Clostridium felsineum]URZ18513.1 hypothetical protein CLFE_046010 [Clostridium felsineum DSM 794]